MAKYLGIQPLADKRKEKRVIEDAKKMDTIIEKVERKTKRDIQSKPFYIRVRLEVIRRNGNTIILFIIK